MYTSRIMIGSTNKCTCARLSLQTNKMDTIQTGTKLMSFYDNYYAHDMADAIVGATLVARSP